MTNKLWILRDQNKNKKTRHINKSTKSIINISLYKTRASKNQKPNSKHNMFSTTIKQRRECVDPPFYPLAHVVQSIVSILHNRSLVAHFYSYSLHFLATLETLVEVFIWPLIMTLGNPKLDLGFFFVFRITPLNP